jgi:hypothetical protein
VVLRSETSEKENENIIYYLRDSRTRAPLTVVLRFFAEGVGTYIYGGKLFAFTSTSNMVLIDVAPSTSTDGPK